MERKEKREGKKVRRESLMFNTDSTDTCMKREKKIGRS
jgi:hypothetical protein